MAVGAALTAVSVAPLWNRLKSSILHLRDEREVVTARLENDGGGTNSLKWAGNTENTELTKQGLSEAAAETNEGNVELRDFRKQMESRAYLLDDLFARGATEVDGSLIRGGYEGEISVSPVPGKLSAKEARRAEAVLNRQCAGLKEYRDSYGVNFVENLDVDVASADEALSRGYLPDARSYMSAVAEGYPKDMAELLKNIGWEGFYNLGAKISRLVRPILPRALKKELKDPANIPPRVEGTGSDPRKAASDPRNRQLQPGKITKIKS